MLHADECHSSRLTAESDEWGIDNSSAGRDPGRRILIIHLSSLISSSLLQINSLIHPFLIRNYKMRDTKSYLRVIIYWETETEIITPFRLLLYRWVPSDRSAGVSGSAPGGRRLICRQPTSGDPVKPIVALHTHTHTHTYIYIYIKKDRKFIFRF